MRRPSQILSQHERLALARPSDLRAAWMVLHNWLLIFVLLGLAGTYPSVLTFLLVWVLLPGRQLGLAVLMHEAGHGSLFRSAQANRWVGQWLCALPTLGDLPSYAAGHTEHHQRAGTDTDPDLPNYRAYPVSRASLRRKVIRDLTGQTGLKLLGSLARGVGGPMGSTQAAAGRLLVLKQVVAQLALFGVLSLMAIGWTWFLWFFTFMTSYMLVIRLRQIAEHAAVPDLFDPDPRRNTRTVVGPWWQHFLLAPNYVNYHMEHHYMAGVPCYRLPDLRAILKARGELDGFETFTGYGQVLRRAVTG